MSTKELHGMKVIICIVMALIGIGISFAFEIKVLSWTWTVGTFSLVSTAFALIGYHGIFSGRGCFAQEHDLGNDLVYNINEIVNLRDGTTLYILHSSINDKAQIVEEPNGGFKKFDVIKGRHLVPKKLKAKMVEGELLMPVVTTK